MSKLGLSLEIMDYGKYLQENSFKSYFSNIKNKLKDKSVIFYGAGEFFCYLYKNVDFSDINIIGISDKSFENSTKTHFENIPIIKPSEIKNHNVDFIILTVLNWQNILFSNYQNSFFTKDCKVIPICKSAFKTTSTSLELRFAEQLFFKYPNFYTFKILAQVKNYNEQTEYAYINKNYARVIQRIKNKKGKIKVAFLCNDDARWKTQSLYDLLDNDELFEPIILFTKLYTEKQTRKQSHEEFIKSYNFFKNQNMKIELAYDIKEEKYLDLSQFSPDIVFYQLPFYCSPIQSPDKVSEYALTAYVPYYTGTSLYETKQDVKFRNKLFRYYLADEGLKEYYESLMGECSKNIRIVGHTSFDIFYQNDIKQLNNGKFQVLYSPHHSIETNSPLHLATFMENGELILQYAQNHPEVSWIFRPHPLLKKMLKTVWTDEKIEEYYKAWQDIGIYETKGNYIDTFLQSNLMINDCSFFREFFPTESPIIQLINPKVVPYDKISEQIIETCYNSHNNEELIKLLDLLIKKRQDPLKNKRLALLKKLNIKNTCASLNIVDDIKNVMLKK